MVVSMVKFTKSKPMTSGPSSALGITRFFDAESKSPKLNPYFVLGAIVIFIIAMLAIKVFF